MKNNQFNNILVVKHGSLGDIAFSLTAMASIKKYFSNANIDLLTEGKYIDFLKNSNYLSRKVICLPFYTSLKNNQIKKIYNTIKKFRST